MAWKKNFRKIPQMILGKLKTIQNPNIVVGCAKTFKQEDLQNGILSHLQINLTEAAYFTADSSEAIALASSTVSVGTLPEPYRIPPLVALPDRMMSRLDPMEAIYS